LKRCEYRLSEKQTFQELRNIKSFFTLKKSIKIGFQIDSGNPQSVSDSIKIGNPSGFP